MQYNLGLIFVLSYIFIWFIRDKAALLGLMDIPNERSIHREHIARGAGIGFYVAVLAVVPFFYLDLLLSHIWTAFAILIVFLIGLLDDRYDMPPKIKFIVIAIAILFLYFDHLCINHIGTFFGVDICFAWFALPFTLFAVSGLTNALNLIDGLDGLAATISLILLGSFFAVGFIYNDQFMMVLSSSFFISLLAFLCYNWYPATIFMGDSGSLTLGFVISILAVKSLDYIPAVIVLFVVAMPVFDTLIVMFRRKFSGLSAFKADRYHMHHLIKNCFHGSTPKTVLFLGLFQLLYAVLALMFFKEMEEGILFIIFILNVLFLYYLLNRIKEKQNI